MGYAKEHYSEPETIKMQQGSRAGAGNSRHRRSTITPGRIIAEKKKKESFSTAWRLVWQRFRRSFIAFRFQANRYTFGLFRRNVLLKIGTLAVGAYILLFAEAGPQFISRETKQSEQGIGAGIG